MEASQTEPSRESPGDALPVEQFRALYDAHYDDLWRYCLRRSASAAAAEDALSETFTVAWRKIASAPPEPGTRPWLFGIARNHLRNAWRKSQRTKALHQRIASNPTSTSTDDPATLAADQSAAVLQALDQLSDRDREILQLAAWEELPHRDIAVLLGCSENAVAIRLHRARDRFSAQLRKTNSSTLGRKVRPPGNRLPVSEPTRNERKRP